MPDPRHRLNDAFDAAGLAEGTRYRYRRAVEGLATYLGSPAQGATTEDVQRYLSHQNRETASPYTSATTLAGLSFYFRHCAGGPEVLRGVHRPRLPHRLPRILSAPNIHRLIDAARPGAPRCALQIAYASGLRLGETCRLAPSDLDRTRGVLTVRTGKGGRQRISVLPPSLIGAVDLYLQGKARLGQSSKNVLLFDSFNQPLTPRRLQLEVRLAAQKAGLSAMHVTFHTLRHCFATNLLEQGVSLAIIQSLLGHARLETTMRYVHVRSDILRTVPDLLATLSASIV